MTNEPLSPTLLQARPESLVFDQKAREEYVTGFQKRRTQRKIQGAVTQCVTPSLIFCLDMRELILLSDRRKRSRQKKSGNASKKERRYQLRPCCGNIPTAQH